MKIYTKTGDKGETSLYGGKRVSKTSARIEAIGNVDEVNTLTGLIIAKLPDKDFKELKTLLTKIQNDLFICGSDLATPKDANERLKKVGIAPSAVKLLEDEIDFYNKELEPMRSFILPGGSEIGALLHQTRSVCRRAERSVVYAMQHEEINKNCQIYLNRLSDLFFVLARYVNRQFKIEEQPWLS